MAERNNNSTENSPAELETPAPSELDDEVLEHVAGGAVSCAPDQDTILPSDDFLIPLDPSL